MRKAVTPSFLMIMAMNSTTLCIAKSNKFQPRSVLSWSTIVRRIMETVNTIVRMPTATANMSNPAFCLSAVTIWEIAIDNSTNWESPPAEVLTHKAYAKSNPRIT